MKRKLTRLLIIGCLLAPGSFNSVAQEKKVGPDEPKVQTDTFKVLASKSALGRVVKGAPYSATATTEHIQTLTDGNQIIRKNQSKLYRDSEGRTRMEQTLETIGKWTTEGEAQQLIFINDPVAGFSYNLDSHTRTARKGGIGINVIDPGDLDEIIRLKKAGQEKARAQNPKVLEANRIKLGDKTLTVDAALKKPEPVKLTEGPGSDERRKTESLGKQMIEGVEVEGSRSTLTIPAGEIGNTLPIEVVDETWYSQELQLMVMSTHRDPRSGETTYRLTNINRSEPDRALFEVPADYTVKDESVPAKKKKPTEEER